MKHPDGSTISQFFKTQDSPTSGSDMLMQGIMVVVGQVEKIHFTDEQSNVSKTHVEYDVSIRDSKGGQNILRNIRKRDLLGGLNDFDELVLEANEYASTGKLDQSNFFKNKNGTTVLVGYLDGSKERPEIVGALQHPKKVGAKKADGVRRKGEFRGLSYEVNKDGDFILQFSGAKKPDGKPANSKLSKTTIKIGKDGKLETSSGHRITFENDKGKEKIQVITSANQIFQLVDELGKETIAMVHKKGALFNIDKDGSAKLVDAAGNYIYLNAKSKEVSIVQADGNMIALTDEITIASADGGKSATIKDDSIQAISDKDIILQASQKAVIDAGSVTLKDLIAKIKIENGQIAIGTPAAELLDLLFQILTQLIQLTTQMASETHIGNLGLPTSPPVNAAAYSAVTAALTVIQALLITIKGTI